MVYIGKILKIFQCTYVQWNKIKELFKIHNKNNSKEKWTKDISSSLMSKSKWQKQNEKKFKLIHSENID